MDFSHFVKYSIAAFAWGMLIFALIAWFVLYRADEFWLGTLLGFGPRWALLAPWTFLVLTSMFWHRRVLVPLGLAGVILVGPVLGLCVPWQTWIARDIEGFSVKVLTFNADGGGGGFSLPEIVAREQPDVVALQEWPSQRSLPEALSEHRGWHQIRRGGLVLASRWPIVDSDFLKSPTSSWGRTMAVRAGLETQAGTVHAYSTHMMTPRDGLSAVLGRRLAGLEELRQNTEQRKIDAITLSRWVNETTGPKLVLGDFNMLPESVIYRHEFGHWQNAFSVAGWGWGRTKFTRWHGVRIDHIFADDYWRVSECRVLADAGSDHRPVVAELVLAVDEGF